MAKGMFVTVEGVEGVGKSTNMDFIAERLTAAGFAVLRSREPGGTPMAERIRDMLLQHGEEPLPDLAELLLFFASRTLNIENAIRPALAAGTWVLCDRFTDASRAYQGAGRGLDMERINTLAEWAHGDLNPDMTVLLDAPAEIGMQRAVNRGETDRLESEQMSFYSRVRAQYLALAEKEPARFAVIDASQPLAAVQVQIATAIDRLISVSKQDNERVIS
jgi:dTMP kinase